MNQSISKQMNQLINELHWRDFFTNATIYALDILPIDRVMDELLNDE